MEKAMDKNIEATATEINGDIEKASNKKTPIDNALSEKASFKVTWTPNNPRNPHSWAPTYKAWLAFQLALLSFVGSFGASIISPAEKQVAAFLDLSLEVTVLTVSLYVLGFAFGPMLWAPLAEVHGRKISILPPMFVGAIFDIATANCETAAGVFVTRFLAGMFASASISNTAAAVGDFYTPKERGVPMAMMSVCIVGGPCLAPLVGAAIAVNDNMGWRWTVYMHAIMTFFLVSLSAVCLPETYHPVLLKGEARRLRQETGDSRYWHPQEEEKIKLSNVLTKYVARPGRMLITEPMVTCIATYGSFVFGLLFFQVQSYAIVFRDIRGWAVVPSTLPFIGLLIGVFFAIGINSANQGPYAKAVARNNGGATAAPRYHWAIPTAASGFIGAGFNVVFQQCLNFLADTYGPYTASAMAANTFLRSVLGCVLPLAARPMFEKLGVGPGCSLLGGLSVLALPVPLVFIKYGLKLRKMSKFAPVEED